MKDRLQISCIQYTSGRALCKGQTHTPESPESSTRKCSYIWLFMYRAPVEAWQLDRSLHLDRSAGNEEPLVNAWVNWSRSLVVTSWNVELGGLGAILRVTDGGVGTKHS